MEEKEGNAKQEAIFFKTRYYFELPLHFKSQPQKFGEKYVYLSSREKEVSAKDYFYFSETDILNFLYLLPINTKTNNFTKKKTDPNIVTLRIMLDDEYMSSYLLTIDQNRERYCLKFISKKIINPNLFYREENSKTLRYYVLGTKSDDSEIPLSHPFRKVGHWLNERKLLNENLIVKSFVNVD